MLLLNLWENYSEENKNINSKGNKIAYLLEKGLPSNKVSQVFAEAEEMRRAGNQVLLVRMNKNKKFQKEQLANNGYTEFKEFFKD